MPWRFGTDTPAPSPEGTPQATGPTLTPACYPGESDVRGCPRRSPEADPEDGVGDPRRRRCRLWTRVGGKQARGCGLNTPHKRRTTGPHYVGAIDPTQANPSKRVSGGATPGASPTPHPGPQARLTAPGKSLSVTGHWSPVNHPLTRSPSLEVAEGRPQGISTPYPEGTGRRGRTGRPLEKGEEPRSSPALRPLVERTRSDSSEVGAETTGSRETGHGWGTAEVADPFVFPGKEVRPRHRLRADCYPVNTPPSRGEDTGVGSGRVGHVRCPRVAGEVEPLAGRTLT